MSVIVPHGIKFPKVYLAGKAAGAKYALDRGFLATSFMEVHSQWSDQVRFLPCLQS